MSYDPMLDAADPVLQKTLDSIRRSGMEVFPEEAAALAAFADSGHLPPMERLVRRALLQGATDARAAEDRQWVRDGRATAVPDVPEADAPQEVVEAADAMAPRESVWEQIEDDDGIRHRPCGTEFLASKFVDLVQFREYADAHLASCPAVGHE